jgi:hypothetical protein
MGPGALPAACQWSGKRPAHSSSHRVVREEERAERGRPEEEEPPCPRPGAAARLVAGEQQPARRDEPDGRELGGEPEVRVLRIEALAEVAEHPEGHRPLQEREVEKAWMTPVPPRKQREHGGCRAAHREDQEVHGRIGASRHF